MRNTRTNRCIKRIYRGMTVCIVLLMGFALLTEIALARVRQAVLDHKLAIAVMNEDTNATRSSLLQGANPNTIFTTYDLFILNSEMTETGYVIVPTSVPERWHLFFSFLFRAREPYDPHLIRVATAKSKAPELIALLLKYGATVHIGEKEELYMVMETVCYGDLAALKLLVEAGAKISGTDRYGRTAIDVARTSQCEKCADFLEQVSSTRATVRARDLSSPASATTNR